MKLCIKAPHRALYHLLFQNTYELYELLICISMCIVYPELSEAVQQAIQERDAAMASSVDLKLQEHEQHAHKLEEEHKHHTASLKQRHQHEITELTQQHKSKWIKKEKASCFMPYPRRFLVALVRLSVGNFTQKAMNRLQ